MPRDYQLQPTSGSVSLRINYAGELNPQQLAAVTASPGPALVLAGAGAGKTRTLTYRVAWLLEHGVPAERILLLTFTNKSAREMMQRVNDLIGEDLSRLWGGTFHSVGLRILRRHADRIGFPNGFTVADREDAKDLLSACIPEAGVDPKATRFPKPEVIAEIYSQTVNTGRTLREVLETDHASFVELTDTLIDIQKRFAARKRAAGLLDFDDLLVLWLRLLQDHADLREWYQRRFQYVLVDEYQDTNVLQANLLDLLAGTHRNLMAVGDDAQSIYSWRGANFANILEFPRRYSDAQVFRIETNYRSTPEILALANAAIAANVRQFPKVLQAVRKPGSKPALVVCNDASEQAVFIAQRVLELRDEGRPLDDICILYRSHFHALELQLELTRRNIPFLITSGIRFFEQAHIKDVAAYLKFLTNPRDELAFKRLARMLPGIGGKGAEKLWERFITEWTSRCGELIGDAVVVRAPVSAPVSDLDGELEDAPPVPEGPRIPVAPVLAALQPVVPKRAAAAWAQFIATLAQGENPARVMSPADLIRHVVEATYKEYVEANYDRAPRRLEELEQLALYAAQFQSVSDFLSQLALQTNLEADESAKEGDDEERLRLSTVHQAKGLEFGAVFVIMLSDGCFPTQRAVDAADALEEERRLFYVAATRGKDELYLLYPLTRMFQGSLALQSPSRFLQEIPQELMEEWRLRGAPAWGNGPMTPLPGMEGDVDEPPF
ncbi:MAG: hypothetical protein RLZ45_1538 [Verrucomicrobiota bacterium]